MSRRRHKRKAHSGQRVGPEEASKVGQPCPSCKERWATFEASGTVQGFFHGACMQVLCGPRLHEPTDTMVKRKVPQRLPEGTKGWWEEK